jgi:creatinine amidohydrolase
MTYIALDLLTWPEAQQFGAEGAIGLLPLAALEQHGPHLPLATDALLAEVLARDVANRLHENVVVIPVARVGLSSHHLGFPGSVSVDAGVYESLVRSYLEGIERMGIGRVGIFSSHGGNFRFVDEFIQSYKGPLHLAGYSDLGQFVQVMRDAAAAAGVEVPDTDIHAGGLETSCMLAEFPHLVRPFAEVTGLTTADADWLGRMLREGVRAFSETGVLGEPRDATAEAGAAILGAIADELADFFTDNL